MRPRVWAPRAERVDLVRGERRDSMRATGGGWFEADCKLKAGERYRFSLDGGAALPDPRSAWQPDGVHGASAVVDHEAFAWTDRDFAGPTLADSVFYELHVGTFTPEGTFDAAIGRLDHLVELGVTTVELMPVAEFPGRRGWGYDGVDLYAPHHAYGGPDGLKRLVDACHRRGLAVVLDVVYNHLGPDGNYLAQYGPYFTNRYATPWGESVNLDGPGSDEVRAFFIDNACMWLTDYHLDGLRLDAVDQLVDRSATHFLEELAARVDTLADDLGRRLFVVAESALNDPRLIWPRTEHGYGVHAQWSDDFHHALHAVLTGEHSGYYVDFGQMSDVARALREGYVYAGQYSCYRRRRHGRPATGVPGWRLLGYAQNHDQVGNRAQGERSAALMSVGRLNIAAALVLTAPFVPMLFQGEEWAASTPFLYFTDHGEDLGRAVREGRRREFAEFGWAPDEVPDPQEEKTYLSSRLEWAEREQEPHARVLDWQRRLLQLRAATPELRDGRLDQVDVQFDEAAGSIVVTRGPVTVVANLATDEVTVTGPDGETLRP